MNPSRGWYRVGHCERKLRIRGGCAGCQNCVSLAESVQKTTIIRSSRCEEAIGPAMDAPDDVSVCRRGTNGQNPSHRQSGISESGQTVRKTVIKYM